MNDHILLHDAALISSKDSKPTEFVDAGTGTTLSSFGPLGRVNTIVGANNSGKSRLLRALVQRESYTLASAEDARRLDHAFTTLAKHEAGNASALLQFTHPNGSRSPIPIHVGTFAQAAATLRAMIRSKSSTSTTELEHLGILIQGLQTPSPPGLAVANTNNIGESELVVCGDLKQLAEGFNPINPPRLVIPTLRSAQSVWTAADGRLHDDVFRATYMHNYPEVNCEVWTGATLHANLLQLQCARREERERKAAFEKFLSRTFFQGRSVELVAQLAGFSEKEKRPFDSYVHFIIDGEERTLFNVGEGIGAITLLLYPLFTAKQGMWAFIEEPEINLHPAYQRVLVETLVSDPHLAKLDLRVFLTTHSNHLLDVAMEYPDEISVFSLSPKEDHSKQVRLCQGRDVRLLDALGVRKVRSTLPIVPSGSRGQAT